MADLEIEMGWTLDGRKTNAPYYQQIAARLAVLGKVITDDAVMQVFGVSRDNTSLCRSIALEYGAELKPVGPDFSGDKGALLREGLYRVFPEHYRELVKKSVGYYESLAQRFTRNGDYYEGLAVAVSAELKRLEAMFPEGLESKNN